MTFIQFAEACGLIINHVISGRWVRVPTVDHPNKRNGAYFHSGEYGHVQNWATMDKVETWFAQDLTEARKESIRKQATKDAEQYRKERIRKQERAAGKARWILEQCHLDQHAYLDSKGFPKMTGNVWRNEELDPVLVVPMRYNGSLCGCQLICIDGSKKFLFGQRTNNSTFTIGQEGRDFIVEGFASGLSLKTILTTLKVPARIHVTFSCGNASNIAKTLPKAIWIADNDVSGTGQKAAAESGLKWWMPPEVGTDVNDMHRKLGLFKASQELRNFLFA